MLYDSERRDVTLILTVTLIRHKTCLRFWGRPFSRTKADCIVFGAAVMANKQDLWQAFWLPSRMSYCWT